jgi:hypothetical protein
VLIDRQSFSPEVSFPVFYPYSFLLGYAYGSGINAYDLNLDGGINAAAVFAGRIDYSIASNLNLYGSFLWAERTGNGYGWGFIDLDPRTHIDDPNGFQVQGNTVQVSNPNYGQVVYNQTVDVGGASRRRTNAIALDAPNIPDKDLGWEVTAGMDWKLLEGFTFGWRWAQWYPGGWFSYACIDKSEPNRGPDKWGIDPNRKIGPVFSFSTYFSALF